MSDRTASSAKRLEWMSESTATRMARGGTLAAGVAAWCIAAWFLSRTSVPSLHLSGVDEHRYFSDQSLRRPHHYSLGEDLLWLVGTAAPLVALVVLARRLPRTVREIGLGRIGTAIVAGMVLI